MSSISTAISSARVSQIPNPRSQPYPPTVNPNPSMKQKPAPTYKASEPPGEACDLWSLGIASRSCGVGGGGGGAGLWFS